MSNRFTDIVVTETKHINPNDLQTKFVANYVEGKLFFLAGWGGQFYEVILNLKDRFTLPSNPTLTTVKELLVANTELLYFIASKNRITLAELQIMKIAPATSEQGPNLKSLNLPT